MEQKFAYRTKLIIFILAIVLMIFLASLYSAVSTRSLYSETQQMMLLSQRLGRMYDQISLVQNNMETFLFTRSSDDLMSFYESSNNVNEQNKQLKKLAAYTERGIKIKNLSAMTEHYLKGLDITVIEKRNENTDEYISGAARATKESANIEGYIQQIMSSDLRENAERYLALQTEIERNTAINNIMLIFTLVIAITGTFLFSYQITKPISQLANYSKAVSDGDYNVKIEENTSSREMNYLYTAFSKMTESIKRNMNEMREKQELEKKLSEVEINSLKMETSLKEAELHALQYQMNPHFIFNTINIGAKIAMLQGDKITCDYLENTADVFRYNLRSMDMDATLGEELKNTEAYLTLLATRFGDMLKFTVEIPEEAELLNFKMPPLILQPLAENAYIHGVSQMENGGEIKLTVNETKQNVNVVISNTGPPILVSKAAEIISGNYSEAREPNKKGHTTNIGMGNVIKRLRLYFGVEDIISIICGGGRTNIILKLPKIDLQEKLDDV